MKEVRDDTQTDALLSQSFEGSNRPGSDPHRCRQQSGIEGLPYVAAGDSDFECMRKPIGLLFDPWRPSSGLLSRGPGLEPSGGSESAFPAYARGPQRRGPYGTAGPFQRSLIGGAKVEKGEPHVAGERPYGLGSAPRGTASGTNGNPSRDSWDGTTVRGSPPSERLGSTNSTWDGRIEQRGPGPLR